MNKHIMIASLAALVATGFGIQADAGCGACGAHAEVKKACPQGCKKPCCKVADTVKKGCGADCKKPCCAKGEIAEINTSGLKALIDAGAKVTILDARSGKYDDGRRIPGAKALAADASEKLIKKAVRSKDALVVTYCGGLKCPASAKLAGRLKELGYKNVIEYRHGIQGWSDAGHEVKKAK